MFVQLALAVGLLTAGGDVLSAAPSSAPTPSPTSGLRVATFDVDATPPIGSLMAYDPVTNHWELGLRARGIVLLGAGEPIVLCAVDWIGLANEGHDAFRDALARAAATSSRRVAVHSLHQHDAPDCDFSAERILNEAGLDPRQFEGRFQRQVLADLERAVRESLPRAQPLTHLGLGEARVDQVASNRRILGPDGKVRATRWTATKDAAIRAEPEGTIDPILSLVSLWNGERPVAVLSYYATHPQSYYRTGMPNPDFPGLARFLRQLAVPAALHIHFTGAGGNIGAGKYNDGSAENRLALAERLADGMRRAWESTKRQPISAADVSWTVESVALPPAKHLTAAKLESDMKERPGAFAAAGGASRLAWLRRCQAGLQLDVQCLKLGRSRILHLPGELFVEYQLAAKAARPDLFVALAAYGDYAPWYIGTEVAYGEGGYETGPDASNVAPEVEAVLMAAIRKLLSSGGPSSGLGTDASRLEPSQDLIRPHHLTSLPIQQVVIKDDFWSPKLKVWREVTIADCFAKFENDRGGAVSNFDRVRDGLTGGHAGPEWYDGLIYEMIRGSADFLAASPDAGLEQRLDGYIDRIAAAAAKDPDGYLNTWTQLMAPNHRWGLNGGNDVMQHDVYNASAMVEAAVHNYRATGKTRLLQVATKLANHMADVMGPPPKQNVVPGHSLGEEALVKLYLLFRERPELKSRMPVPVEEERYLKLAEFWIENRGNHEGRQSYGAYAQDHKPVLQQETIEGHAVRATLLCAGLVAAGTVNGREDYLTAAQRLWNNMVERRMYVIGGLGAVAGHEGFGPDYVLPNNGYLETCAAIGAGFFHQNMNLAFADARYADELERVLYNGVLSGVSLKGDTYFYENPLEAGPNRTRWAWHGCPCCPPMFLKIMGALPGYIYAQDQGAVYVNLFVGSQASLTVNGAKVILRQTTRYPWDGAIRLSIEPERQTEFAINVRLPAWCAEPRLKVNGKPPATFERVRGYARLQRKWRRGDLIELALPMPVQRIKADPQVEADIGRVALQRGPIDYCLEAVDNSGHVRNLIIPPDAQFRVQYRADVLGGVTIIKGPALGVQRVEWRDTLYLPSSRMPGVTNLEFTAVPYFANANRQPGEMMVWIAETASQALQLPPLTQASRAIPSASHCWANDKVSALNDQVDPTASDDTKIPRFTWWDLRGTKEWVQYDFGHLEKVSAVEVYWWDERRIKAHCCVPQSWRLLYQTGGEWKPVAGASAYTTEMDRFNRVTFDAVNTTALRIEVQLQPEWSGGLLEWRVESPGS